MPEGTKVSRRLQRRLEAFGRFSPNKPLPPREFEVQFRIEARSGPGAWRSGLQSVQRLLDHLSRYTRSESSREKYMRSLLQFSKWSGLSPEELVRLPRRRAELVVQEFADRIARSGASPAYVNSVIKRLRTFFRVNGYGDNREVKVHGYFVPTRYRKVPEYIPTKDEVYRMAERSSLICWTHLVVCLLMLSRLV